MEVWKTNIIAAHTIWSDLSTAPINLLYWCITSGFSTNLGSASDLSWVTLDDLTPALEDLTLSPDDLALALDDVTPALDDLTLSPDDLALALDDLQCKK